MPTVNESSSAGTELAASLAAGVETLSLDQTIAFTKYVRVVLPLDGFVFWVKADQVTASGLYNAARYNQYPYNTGATISPAAVVNVPGSLHYATRTDQREDETAGINTVIFTAQEAVQDFNEIGQTVMFIGEFDGIRFAFNERSSYYQQSGLHHYRGNAIYPALESQVVDDVNTLDLTNVVVSNSLPIWLALDKIMPVFPSFLVDSNLRPPYASIHIDPNQTEVIAAAPRITKNGSHYQLTKDRVRVTIYGLRNDAALDYQDYIFQYSLDTDDIGIMNMPTIRDDKRTQSELSVIAQKKTIDFEVSYYQQRVRNISRQLILSALVTVTPLE